MDVALAIEKLIPAAKYGGSTTSNTKEQYEELRWEDDRPKPSWGELESAWVEVEKDLLNKQLAEQEEILIQEKMRQMAREELIKEGKIAT